MVLWVCHPELNWLNPILRMTTSLHYMDCISAIGKLKLIGLQKSREINPLPACFTSLLFNAKWKGDILWRKNKLSHSHLSINDLVTVVLKHGRLCSWRQLVMSGDIFDCHSLGKGLLPTGVQWEAIRDVAECESVPRQDLYDKELSVPKVNTAETWKLLISLPNQKIGSS